ncbi:MAG: hypothetical protein L3J38_00950 [Thiomicrorhabdus sp.]|nr:hypothetical protein [Thiomicrorhabdus sp.]
MQTKSINTILKEVKMFSSLDEEDITTVEKDYNSKYIKLVYFTEPFKLKKVNLATKSEQTIIARGNGLTIDGKTGIANGNNMLLLRGIDPKNKERILAAIASSNTVIESKDGGYTWREFIPQISGNHSAHQGGNTIFAPSDSLYDVILLGRGSAYGVLVDAISD